MRNTVDVRIKAKGVSSAFGGFEVSPRMYASCSFFIVLLTCSECLRIVAIGSGPLQVVFISLVSLASSSTPR